MNDMDPEADKLETAVRLAKALLEVSFHVRTLAWRRAEEVSDESDPPTSRIPLRNVARLLAAVGVAEVQLTNSSELLPPFIADVAERVLSDIGGYFAVLGTAILFPSAPDSPPLLAGPDEGDTGFAKMTGFIDGLALAVAVSGVEEPTPSANAMIEETSKSLQSVIAHAMREMSARAEQAPGYLGIRLDFHLKATRHGRDWTADFGRHRVAWHLFVCLYHAGEAGRHFRDLMRDLGMEERSETAIRQQMIKANELIGKLNIVIEATGTGVWKPVPLKVA